MNLIDTDKNPNPTGEEIRRADGFIFRQWVTREELEKMYPSKSEEFTCVGWKCNELLYYWRGEYWRWTRSPMVASDPPHVFEKLTDEHKEEWNLTKVTIL